jgi:serine phosphatase RsbU (regulator of sigma subunit)
MEVEYRSARSSEQVRVAEALNDLQSTAGVLVVDAQGHGLISAKIASTVHDTFHAFMLSELDHHGTTTPELFENMNLRLAHSVTARNALGVSEENAREIATMLYGEVHPYGYFRFVNFGHPPPLVFSAEYRKFVELDKDRMVQFLPLGLQIPSDHPDRKRYFSMQLRSRPANSSDVAEITLMSPGDILFLYTDGVYDGSDDARTPTPRSCDAGELFEVSERHLQCADGTRHKRRRPFAADWRRGHIDDKTVFIIKRE